MIVVTGGTGLLGSHLLVELSKKYNKVLCLYRTKSKIAEVEKVFSYYNLTENFKKIEFVEVDLDDYLLLEKQLNEGDTIYHCAASISFDPRDAQQMILNNHNATINVVNACLAKNVTALCHVSSVAALGKAKNNNLINEENYWKPEDPNSNYALSKYLAENEVWRGIEEGLNAVIVNPSVILGEGFWNTGSGNLFLSAYKNKNKFYTNGITGYVDVRDVVKAMISLTEEKKFGKRFIVSSENLSYKEIFTLINKSLNIREPFILAGRSLLGIAWRFNKVIAYLTGSKAFFTKETADAAVDVSKFEHLKIKQELHFKFNSVSETVTRIGKQFLKEQ